MQWRPIETAPKDGTEVLVFLEVAGTEIVHIASWLEDSDGVGDWWSYTRNSVSLDRLGAWRAPTHWLPFSLPRKE